MRKPPNYWKNPENIKSEMNQITSNLGHYPTQNELRRLGRRDLIGALYKNYDGIRKFGESLGYFSKTHPGGYWKDIKNVKKEVKNIIKKFGYLPHSDELRTKGYSSLVNAATKYHGGFIKIKNLLGYKTRRPKNYLKNFENVKREIIKIRKKIGHFPNSEDLRKYDMSLLNAICKYHCGLYQTELKLNPKTTKKPPGYWKDIKNLKKEMEIVIKKLGRYPKEREVRKNNFTLLGAIRRYYGVRKFREIMGYPIKKHPNGFWKDWNNVKMEMEGFIRKFHSENKRLPKAEELRKLNGGFLVAATKYHGGIRNVYSRLGYLPTISTEGFINFVENDEHLKEIVKRIGNDPITLYDVLAVKYGGILERKEFLKLFKEPSLREYLDDFINPINGIDDLVELVKHALPFDRDDRIKTILIKKGIENIIEQIGPLPQDGEIESKIAELDRKLYDL